MREYQHHHLHEVKVTLGVTPALARMIGVHNAEILSTLHRMEIKMTAMDDAIQALASNEAADQALYARLAEYQAKEESLVNQLQQSVNDLTAIIASGAGNQAALDAANAQIATLNGQLVELTGMLNADTAAANEKLATPVTPEVPPVEPVVEPT